MKNIVIRKPKFMRNDKAMLEWIMLAETCSKMADKANTADERLYVFENYAECINNAAKAGGFFTTADFIVWLNLHKKTT